MYKFLSCFSSLPQVNLIYLVRAVNPQIAFPELTANERGQEGSQEEAAHHKLLRDT